MSREEMLLGHWAIHDTFKKNSYLFNMHSDNRGFEFVNDSICNFKAGYFDHEDYGRRIRNKQEKRITYLGAKTKYRLYKDSLRIFNFSENKWDSFKIKKLTNDTLIINRSDGWATFLKRDYSKINVPDFDAIVISSGGCHSACPVTDIIIYKNGFIQTNLSHYTPKKGNFTSNITSEEFKKIAEKFKQANYYSLPNETLAQQHGQFISVSFVKNGRIIKTIEDLGTESFELDWATQPLIYLHQKLNLKKIKVPDFLSPEFRSMYFPDTGLLSKDSESYYILSRLQSGKQVNNKFVEKHNLRYINDKVDKVTTDGRYYKFYLKDGTNQTIDIGFNFLEANKENLK